MAKFFSTKNIIPKGAGLLNNRYLLYGILAIALLDLYYFYAAGQGVFALLLILVGIITSFFNKNMIVILVVSLVVTNILKFGNGLSINEGFREGLEGKKKDGFKASEEKDNDEGEVEKDEPKEKKTSSKKLTDLSKETTDLVENQNKLMENMDKLEPLLERAEKFIAKYESMKNKEGMRAKK